MPKTKEMKSSFGAKLRAIRLQRDWSQARLAEEAGLSQAMIHYLESAKKQPSLAKAIALAKALGIGLEELI